MALVAPGGVMSVLVITDSAGTVPADLAERLGVEVLPLRLSVDGDSLRDGDLPMADLLARDPKTISTSGPSPGDFLEVLERRASDDGTLIVTVAHDLASSTFSSARAAARMADTPVRVLDSQSAAGAQGLVVLAAAARARRGAGLDDVEAAATTAANRVRLVAALPNLDHVARSGHVPGAGAWATRFIGLRPLIELRFGTVRPLRPALSDEAAADAVLKAWRRTIPDGPARLHVAALHAEAEERAVRLLDAVQAEVEPATSFVGSFGVGMIVHSGPDLVGLGWWWEDDAER